MSEMQPGPMSESGPAPKAFSVSPKSPIFCKLYWRLDVFLDGVRQQMVTEASTTERYVVRPARDMGGNIKRGKRGPETERVTGDVRIAWREQSA